MLVVTKFVMFSRTAVGQDMPKAYSANSSRESEYLTTTVLIVLCQESNNYVGLICIALSEICAITTTCQKNSKLTLLSGTNSLPASTKT